MNRELKTWRDVIQAMLDGEELEYYLEASKSWVDFLYLPSVPVKELTHQPRNRCRIKPKTIMIGDMEVPEPVRYVSELEIDEKYFVSLIGSGDFCSFYHWNGDEFDLRMLRRGLIHKTKEAAILHAKALIKISGGSYE